MPREASAAAGGFVLTDYKGVEIGSMNASAYFVSYCAMFWPNRHLAYLSIELPCENDFAQTGSDPILRGTTVYLAPTLIDELLEALSFVRFRYVDVPLGVGRNIVRAIELTGPVSTASELANNLQ